MMPRLRLLMTADAVGGVWTYAAELCAALAGHSVDVVLATLGPPPDSDQRQRLSRIGSVRLVCGDYRLEWMDDSSEDVRRSGEWLQRIATDESVDVIHLNGYAHAALSWPQPVVVVAHSCVGTWWHAVHGGPPPVPKWAAYLEAVAAGLAGADCVIAPTGAFLGQMAALYGPLPRARVIPNALSAEPYVPATDLERLPIVFASGRIWDEAKRLHVLDAAAGALPWPVYIAGDARSPDGRMAECRSARIMGRLPAHEIRRFLHSASIFVHPACYEPFGLSVLEAAHAGCALLLADIPTLRESWDGAAAFVDAGNPQALRTALLELIEQPSRRLQLARAAQARAGTFSPSGMGAAYAELYHELLQRTPSARTIPGTEIAAA